MHIEIDGGVTLENAAYIIAAGADVLVAGNTVFNLRSKSNDCKTEKTDSYLPIIAMFLQTIIMVLNVIGLEKLFVS